MVVEEMNDEECRSILARNSIGRLGCARNDQPYVLPAYFAYDAGYIYMFSTFGEKIEWMRANPKVCVEVEELAESGWVSVIANGRYQELPEPQYAAERAYARKLLGKRYRWWGPALAERQAKTLGDAVEALFFRVQIDSITGLRTLDGDARQKSV